MALTVAQVDAYLERIGLHAAETRSRPPDTQLLGDLQAAHLLTIPFDTTLNHFDPSSGPETPVQLGKGPCISCTLQEAYTVIVQQRRGSYCFALNGLFEALLAHLGYTVYSVPASVFQMHNADPEQVGWDHFPGFNHRCLLVHIGSERYLTDVGFGAACSFRPIRFDKGQEEEGIGPEEHFKLTEQGKPGSDERYTAPQWMLWRRFAPNGQHWAPVYHVTLQQLGETDWQALNYYNAHAPEALFVGFLLVTNCLPSSRRQVLCCGKDEKEATFYTRDGFTGEKLEEIKIPLTVGAVSDIMVRKFGML